MSSTQNECTFGGGRVGGGEGGLCSKMNKGEQGGRGAKLGNLERTYFLNVPKLAFRNNAPFISCIFKVNNTHIDITEA